MAKVGNKLYAFSFMCTVDIITFYLKRPVLIINYNANYVQ